MVFSSRGKDHQQLDESGILRTERRWTLLRGRRRLQFLRAALVGLMAGTVAVFFQWALYIIEEQRTSFLVWIKTKPSIWMILPPLLAAVLAGLSGWMTRRVSPESAGSGIPHIKAVLLHLRPIRWHRILPVKFFGGLMSIGAGLSLGREGPTVQMGAALGQWAAKIVKAPPRARDHLLACGGGAGLAAAFNAPLAGFVFVIEEFQRDLSPLTYGTALIAAVTADIVTRFFNGQWPSFAIRGYPLPPLSALPLYALVGVAAALMGVLFNRSLLWTTQKSQKLTAIPAWSKAALAGLIAGIIGLWLPAALGGGHRTAEAVLSGHFSGSHLLGFLTLLLLVKFLLTMISYGSGVPGGIFAPLLVLGALIGTLLGDLASFWFPSLAQTPAAFAVAGMASLFSATIRAPLTGIVLILEMTENYSQLFPLLVACLSAHVVAEAFGQRPIYDALMDQDLRRATPGAPVEEEPSLVDLIVEPESKMAGRSIGSLGIPSGCLIVHVKRHGREFVPDGRTILHPGDEVAVIISGDQGKALHQLHLAAKTRFREQTAGTGRRKRH